ncbi:MAG: hypothetical protein ACE5EW_04425 [Thermoplasmata archaeon]
MVVLVAGMIMVGLGMYFETPATVNMVLVGGLFIILGLITLGTGGALRFVGALLLVVGIIGTVFGVVGTSALLPGIFVGIYLYYILPTGIVWGPALMIVGLGLLLGYEWRKRVAISA